MRVRTYETRLIGKGSSNYGRAYKPSKTAKRIMVPFEADVFAYIRLCALIDNISIAEQIRRFVNRAIKGD